jgi:hypothetical protein
MTPQKATNPETLWEAPNFQAMQCQHTPTIHQASTRCTNPKNHVNLRQKMTKMQIKVWSIEDVLQSQLQWGHCSWQSVGSLRAELCPTRLLMCQSQNRFRFGKQMQDPKPLFGIGFATTWDGFIWFLYCPCPIWSNFARINSLNIDSSFSVSVLCPYLCPIFAN